MANRDINTFIPVDLQDVLIKLKFLSMIERGNKVNVSSMNFVSSDSLLGALLRTYNHENRRTTYTFVNGIVDLTVDAMTHHGINSIFLEKLVRGLHSARVGINELASTYREDPEMVSKMAVCLDKVDLQLKKYHHLIRTDEPGTPEGEEEGGEEGEGDTGGEGGEPSTTE